MARRTDSYDLPSDAGDDLLAELSRTRPIEPFLGTDRYRVRRCLGEGGFGKVKYVRHKGTDKGYAMKCMDKHIVRRAFPHAPDCARRADAAWAVGRF